MRKLTSCGGLVSPTRTRLKDHHPRTLYFPTVRHTIFEDVISNPHLRLLFRDQRRPETATSVLYRDRQACWGKLAGPQHRWKRALRDPSRGGEGEVQRRTSGIQEDGQLQGALRIFGRFQGQAFDFTPRLGPPCSSNGSRLPKQQWKLTVAQKGSGRDCGMNKVQ